MVFSGQRNNQERKKLASKSMAEKAMRKTKSESQKRIPSFTDDDDEESASSPLRFHSPLRSDDPETAAATALTISPVARPIAPIRSKRRRHFSPYPSQRTLRPSLPPSPLSKHSKPPQASAEGVNVGEEDVETPVTPEKSESPLQVAVLVREEDAGTASEGRRRSVGAMLRRSKKVEAVERAALGIRVCEVAMCVVSFAVMATNRTQGWSGDSFDRYKEYRYCLCVAIIAFVYSGFQAMDLACSLATGRHLIQHDLRYHFDFCMDQILAYLLISASSSAATRVNDWESNWGKDEFTQKATASVSTAFLAFIFFAISSMLSGYNCVLVRNSDS